MISEAFTVSLIYIQLMIDPALLTKAEDACAHVHHHALMGKATMKSVGLIVSACQTVMTLQGHGTQSL